MLDHLEKHLVSPAIGGLSPPVPMAVVSPSSSSEVEGFEKRGRTIGSVECSGSIFGLNSFKSILSVVGGCCGIFVLMQLMAYSMVESSSSRLGVESTGGMAASLLVGGLELQHLAHRLTSNSSSLAISEFSDLDAKIDSLPRELIDAVLEMDNGDSPGEAAPSNGEVLPHVIPTKRPRRIVAPPAPPAPKYSEDDRFHLVWEYVMEEKLLPYVGNEEFVHKYPKNSSHYLNSLAVFPGYSNTANPLKRYHGILNVYPDGSEGWQKDDIMPPALNESSELRAASLKYGGGFYLNLSNALPLDRTPLDAREDICKSVQFDYDKMGDASVVITFYNEPLSTLLRTVHSVLNLTPPPLLREIILVDDHSNLTDNLPGGPLYEYLKLLPKTKLLRLPERRGLVWARLAGAQVSKASALVVLDSHVEVNEGWLEPQLARLHESPKSIVFPQVLAINADDFTYNRYAGIGCWLSWKWSMVEQASLMPTLVATDAIPSASMAGGLFAVNLDWFWEIGGYDEQFSMWGAENVEMGFRTWMCGGRLECTPCAYTYHIYRDGGVGYNSPSDALAKNRLRTARAWMGEWYQISAKFIGHGESFDYGDLDAVLELKKRLNCRSFDWFIHNVDPLHDGQELTDIELLGEVASKDTPMCLDSLNHYKDGETFGVFWCHHSGGTQGFYKTKQDTRIRAFLDENKCLSVNDKSVPVLTGCGDHHKSKGWSIVDGKLMWKRGTPEEKCLTVVTTPGEKSKYNLAASLCSSSAEGQLWTLQPFVPDPDFQLPDFSAEYKERNNILN